MTNREIDLNEQIAARLLGWKWVSYFGRPTKNEPDYPAFKRVRIFVSPEQLRNVINGHPEPADATGDEPLAYCYCSSGGWPEPPWVSSSVDACLETIVPEMDKRGFNFVLTGTQRRFVATFWKGEAAVDRASKNPALAICKAALAALGVEGGE